MIPKWEQNKKQNIKEWTEYGAARRYCTGIQDKLERHLNRMEEHFVSL